MEKKKVIQGQDEELIQHKEEVMSENEDEDDMNDRWILPSSRNNENSNSYSNNSGDDGGFASIVNEDDLLVETRRGRSNPYWTPEVEKVFIDRIKSYPPLYDHSNENWKNTTVKDVIWEEISVEIGFPGKNFIFGEQTD